jgi:KUP system potassium uptake protein
VVALVLGFKSSSNLAAAYGIAVTGTMVCTTFLSYFVARGIWSWSRPAALAVTFALLCVDLPYFGANLVKVHEGGWFPLVIGAGVFTLMTTWNKGREIFLARVQADALSLDAFLARMKVNPPLRVPGTSVFLTSNRDGVPYALLHNMKHNKVLHKRVVFLTVQYLDVPRVPVAERFDIDQLDPDIYRIGLRYGFKDEPDLPQALRDCAGFGIKFNMMETSFFLGRETLIPTRRPDMAYWREKLFVSMAHNAASVTEFFRIPSNRVVELGTQIEL